jgi:pectate lyase
MRWSRTAAMTKVGGGAPGVLYFRPWTASPKATGGAGGQTATVITRAQLNQLVTASTPYIIWVAGSGSTTSGCRG